MIKVYKQNKYHLNKIYQFLDYEDGIIQSPLAWCLIYLKS